MMMSIPAYNKYAAAVLAPLNPKHMRMVAGTVKHGTFLYCPCGSHMSFHDDQPTYMRGLTRWLLAVDRGEKKAAL